MYAVYSVPSGNNEQQATLKVAPLPLRTFIWLGTLFLLSSNQGINDLFREDYRYLPPQ